MRQNSYWEARLGALIRIPNILGLYFVFMIGSTNVSRGVPMVLFGQPSYVEQTLIIVDTRTLTLPISWPCRKRLVKIIIRHKLDQIWAFVKIMSEKLLRTLLGHHWLHESASESSHFSKPITAAWFNKSSNRSKGSVSYVAKWRQPTKKLVSCVTIIQY